MNEEQLEKQLQKLFRAFSERLVETETAIKADIAELRDEIQVSNDKLAKRLDIDDDERAAVEGQVNRHEGWITQLADSTGTKLVPEP